MPITFPAHAAAILPFRRVRVLPGTALVVGSAAPDFAFLVRGDAGVFSHSAWGLVLVSLPVGVLMYALLEALLLPELRRTGRVFSVLLESRGLARSLGAWGAVVGAVLLGALTHLAWDRLTHGDRWPANVVLGIEGAARAHLASSILGSLVVLAWCGLRLHRRRNLIPARVTRGGGGLLAGVLAAVFAAFAAHAQLPWLHQTFTPGWFAFAAALSACTAIAWARRHRGRSLTPV